jgi:hypothetical protein
VVPGLLLLVARDLALYDPPRVLAWRLTHDSQLARTAAGLGPLLPSPSGLLDRDPVALLLATGATLLALGYAALAALGARPAVRAAVLVLAALLLVVLPSAAFIAMGSATGRPYGQDGGIVQLPLALDKILAGESPYGADYSGTILARQARVSSFWEPYGGNPILHHHAYLPGTHLVMMPFYLGCRAALGFFDPRFVTLLFYTLVVVLAGRVPGTTEARLAAAGVAALNPLVYWHQIFGANDLVFVATLLATLLAARAGRTVAAGALLGLACATKQLAWPFAPFLLVALSGARGFRALAARATWRRLVWPAVAAVVVLLAVVVPVAALDFRAFWGDIVVYNVGLSGADNYPLGGTPGFGFANYLIYFGRVASLKDHVPFSAFYLLLVPLGLLLLWSQMRDGSGEWALVTGTVALVASLYFSRVVHPNYLVPAAILLPVGLLACRRAADMALVPLLLLTLAVETAESAVFRTTWEQAAAAGLPARVGGLVAALAPRAGPGLTRDPLGLLFSATAAGLGVLYLAVAVLGAGRRVRSALVVLAAVLVVAVPLLVVVSAGERTGLVRAQDAWAVQARADAARLLAGRSPYAPPPDETPLGREALSASFRLDPPAELRPERALLPPGASVLTALGRLAGLRDPRLLSLLALAVLGLLAARAAPAEARPTALALVLLPAPLAMGTVLGSPAALPLAALVATGLAAAAGHGRASGLLGGAAAGLDHGAALAAPLLAKPAARAGWARVLWAAAMGYAVLVLPPAVLDPGAFLSRLVAGPAPGPGLGVVNLLAYSGWEGSPIALSLLALSPLLAVGVTLALVRVAAPPLPVAAVAALVTLVLAPAVSPEAVAVPLVLLSLAALEPG